MASPHPEGKGLCCKRLRTIREAPSGLAQAPFEGAGLDLVPTRVGGESSPGRTPPFTTALSQYGSTEPFRPVLEKHMCSVNGFHSRCLSSRSCNVNSFRCRGPALFDSFQSGCQLPACSVSCGSLSCPALSLAARAAGLILLVALGGLYIGCFLRRRPEHGTSDLSSGKAQVVDGRRSVRLCPWQLHLLEA